MKIVFSLRIHHLYGIWFGYYASHYYERVTNQKSFLSTSMEALFDKHGNELNPIMSYPPDVLSLQENGINAQHNMKVRSLFQP